MHRDGPAMVLAGPGSGKTTVITHRVRQMMVDGIDPAGILVITFSRAAAEEMRKRFFYLMDRRQPPVTFGTFHAVFFHILKHAYGYTASQIVREEQRSQFVREYIHRLRLEYDDEADFIKNILGEISLIKNSGIDPTHYYSSSCGEEIFRKIYNAYQECLDGNRLIDFDDMLVYTKDLFEKRPDILAGWQKRYPYILIDEFQDINLLQYEIVRMLSQPKNNLFIVGDDDQSIYRFRGSKPEIMLNFEKDYPGAKTIFLSTNYRSGTGIVRIAGNLISHNKTRFKKDIRPAATEGIAPVVRAFPTQKEQNLFVIKCIQELAGGGVPYDEMAVLFRTNLQPGLFIQQLFEYNIPFVSKEHIPNVFDHWIARDLMTYMRLAQGDRSRSAFLKIMNRPKRYLSRESLPYEAVDFRLWKQFYANQKWMVPRIEKLEMDLNVIGRMRPFSAINYIRKAVDYEGYLKDFAEERKLPVEDLMDVLDELQDDASGFDSFEDWFDHADEVKKEWAEQFAKKETADPAVHLTTLHGSKGLEFDTVFMVDVCEGLTPYKKAVLDPDIEEERRLFYVGMTRAKRRLYLLNPARIRNKDMEPSRFLGECEGIT